MAETETLEPGQPEYWQVVPTVFIWLRGAGAYDPRILLRYSHE